MKTGNNFSSHISIDKVLRKLKTFSEDIELSVTADKTDERDRSVRNGVNMWQSELWMWEDRGTANAAASMPRKPKRALLRRPDLLHTVFPARAWNCLATPAQGNCSSAAPDVTRVSLRPRRRCGVCGDVKASLLLGVASFLPTETGCGIMSLTTCHRPVSHRGLPKWTMPSPCSANHSGSR